jgi:hypothetical protein
MAQKITNTTFTINTPSVALNEGEKLIVRFRMVNNDVPLSNFTASIGQGNLRISSLAASTGYTTVNLSPPVGSQAFPSASMADPNNTNEIVLSTGITGFYGGEYLFVPNPVSGSESSLYENYGDVDYAFNINPFDMVLIYLSDGTYIESRILRAYEQGGLLRLTLDILLSNSLRSELINRTYKRFLILSRQNDETNVILSFTKRSGKTSYGFLIPENISPTVIGNIDTITREVKQKLLNDQSVINDINGGNF